ncbi:MAG: hypothetical protein RLZZ401_720 [Pseudomonadota bacterium]
MPPMSSSKLIANYALLACQNGKNVGSPCISVCVMHAGAGLCQGCFRTLEEIAGWSRMADPEKSRVWDRLLERAQQGDRV